MIRRPRASARYRPWHEGRFSLRRKISSNTAIPAKKLIAGGEMIPASCSADRSAARALASTICVPGIGLRRIRSCTRHLAVMVAAPGAAAAQRQETGIHKQAVGEEFSSQKRCVSRRASVRRPAARYSYSYGYPYLAGYGSSPYPAAWESTRGYRYSARDNQASFSWGGHPGLSVFSTG